MKRIGIYAGTFDPVHKGHIAFALQAARQANLDRVYFVPEQLPRGKDGVTHIGHRVAMLDLALVPYQRLRVLELPDKHFSMPRSLARLHRIFPGATLFRLIGSDVVPGMANWPDVDRLLQTMQLIIGLRDQDDPAEMSAYVKNLPTEPKELHIVVTQHSIVSSTIVRMAIERRRNHTATPELIKAYIRENWLYVNPVINNARLLGRPAGK